MIKENYTISDQEKAAYDKNGYLIVRNVLSLHETDNFRRLVQQRAKTNGYPPSLKYPAPGKYTVSGNQMAALGDAMEIREQRRAAITKLHLPQAEELRDQAAVMRKEAGGLEAAKAPLLEKDVAARGFSLTPRPSPVA